MPVQAQAIPYVLAGHDVKVQSRTGSGKTGGFVLPMMERIDPKLPQVQALVLCPTRELANQVAQEARTLSANSGIKSAAIIGGAGYRKQINAIKSGAHILVGTPGRVLDHLDRGTITLDHIDMLVLDEADRMLSIGFYPDMKAVKGYIPADKQVTTCMFSATFPPHVLRLADEFLTDPITLSLSSDHVHVTEVAHIRVPAPGMDKDRALVKLIEVDNPDSALVFCNRKTTVEYVTTILTRFGLRADYLSGDLAQHKREKVLKRIKDGKIRFLVATDVAARGIDINQLSHVYQYDVPDDQEAYIHRAGRTGRAGASGTAITLYDTVDTLNLNKIERLYNVQLEPRPLPTDEEVAEITGRRARVLLTAELRNRDSKFKEQMVTFEPMVELLCSDADGIRALALLIERYYHTNVHSGGEASAKKPKTLSSVKPLTQSLMEKIAIALNEDLSTSDQVQTERIARFEPLVETLAMSADDFNLLTLLLTDFYLNLN